MLGAETSLSFQLLGVLTLDFASHYHSFLLEHVGECSCKLWPNLYKLSDLFWESGSWRYMNGERLDESLGIWRKWKLVALLKLERGRPGERKIPDLKQRISEEGEGKSLHRHFIALFQMLCGAVCSLPGFLQDILVAFNKYSLSLD